MNATNLPVANENDFVRKGNVTLLNPYFRPSFITKKIFLERDLSLVLINARA